MFPIKKRFEDFGKIPIQLKIIFLIKRTGFGEAIVELAAHPGGRINLGGALEVGRSFVPGTSSLLMKTKLGVVHK